MLWPKRYLWVEDMKQRLAGHADGELAVHHRVSGNSRVVALMRVHVDAGDRSFRVNLPSHATFILLVRQGIRNGTIPTKSIHVLWFPLRESQTVHFQHLGRVIPYRKPCRLANMTAHATHLQQVVEQKHLTIAHAVQSGHRRALQCRSAWACESKTPKQVTAQFAP